MLTRGNKMDRRFIDIKKENTYHSDLDIFVDIKNSPNQQDGVRKQKIN